jgi:peptide/nickel transport system permease protein
MRRLLESFVVIVLVSIIVFLAVRILPGDPIRLVVSAGGAQSYTEEQLTALRHEYGLDRPMFVQYLSWVGNLLRGDLGKSLYSNTPVWDEILRRLPITFHLGLFALAVGIIIGVPVGIISAIRRGKWIDQLVITLTNLGITIPLFWLGLILMLIFGLRLRWLPVMGYTSPFVDFWLNLRELVMPVFCLSVFPMASMARQTRSSMLEVMRQDYIRTAWSQGWKERDIIFKHALKNGLILTLVGINLRNLVGGTVIVETVFNIPGMGRLAVTSVQTQDYAYVQGIILIIAIAVVLINLLVEISYGWADPRIRFN